MHFTFSEAAQKQLQSTLAPNEQLRLLYDTEGCGCVMNGVPTLQLVTEPPFGDRLASGDPYEVWVQPRYEVFFEDQLKIDYSAQSHSFSLKSNNQTYTNSLQVRKT